MLTNNNLSTNFSTKYIWWRGNNFFNNVYLMTGITFMITVQFTLSLSFCGYLKRLATNWRAQFLHRALIPVRHHSWFHLALSISHNQFGPSSRFQDRFILEAIHSSTLCLRSVWGSTWCVFLEEIFHYLKVCTWSMVRGARLNGSDWSESRCLKRRVDPWGHLCSCN